MGWQRQRHGATVQGELEAALTEIAAHPIEVHCAGRTDTGVHALGQVVHFDTTAERSEYGWLRGANSLLPPDISVRAVLPVANQFHARFAAEARRYQYWIINSATRSALLRDRAYQVSQPLDARDMHGAAQLLLGEHDFSSFRAAGCQAKTAVRSIVAIGVRARKDWLCLDITANAFLQHMVRNIAGTLVAVGRGELGRDEVTRILAARDRTAAPFAAPAHGLYFCQALYPERVGVVASPSWAGRVPFSPDEMSYALR